MTLRRVFVVLLAVGIPAGALPSGAQQPAKVPRIGVLWPSSPSVASPGLEAFRRDQSALGYIEGQYIAIEYRTHEEWTDRLTDLAADLVGLKVDLSVVGGTPAARRESR